MTDARWNDPREYDERDREDGRPLIYGERDRDDHAPRCGLIIPVSRPAAFVENRPAGLHAPRVAR